MAVHHSPRLMRSVSMIMGVFEFIGEAFSHPEMEAGMPFWRLFSERRKVSIDRETPGRGATGCFEGSINN